MSRTWYQYATATARDAPAVILQFAYRKAVAAVVDPTNPYLGEEIESLSFEALAAGATEAGLDSFERFRRRVRQHGATSGALFGGGRPHPESPIAWTGTVPRACDLCGSALTDEFYDTRTDTGVVRIVCPDCFVAQGLGLGVGRGRWYRRLAGETYTLLAGGIDEKDIA